jgi:hypothetical protein
METTLPKYASRWSHPFVGYLGWAFYVWDGFVVAFMLTMFIDGYHSGWAPIMIVPVTIIVSFAFWLANGCYFAPNYQTRVLQACDGNTPAEVVMVREEREYASKVRHDLRYHNDEEHFRGELFRSIVLLVPLGIFVGTMGVDNTFQAASLVYSDVSFSTYIISKGFLIMILGSAAWSFGRLAETHSDFAWRHMTAINEEFQKKNNGQSLPVGQQNNNSGVNRRVTNALGIKVT